MDTVYDVAIVGAGLAGLTTAYRLRGKGRKVIVLEAKSRPGGRLFNQSVPGGVVDGGGSWVGPQQTAILGLLKELGIATWPQYTTGHNILMWDHKLKLFTGETPPLPLMALIDTGVAVARLNRQAKQLIGKEPWRHRRAQQLDSQTLGQWLDHHIHTDEARFFFEIVTGTSFGCRPDELSLLGFLAHVASAGSIETLTGVKHAALDRHIAGGAGGVCQTLASKLEGCIQYSALVTTIDQSVDPVTLTATKGLIRAKKVVIATDPATARTIKHTPELPAERALLQQRYRMGSGIKAHFIYDTPFWRADKLSGESIANTGLVRITFDVTPPKSQAGVLMCFMGQAATDQPELLAANAAARRKQRALEELAERFGDAAARPIDYLEQNWSNEPYQSGCVPMPGVGMITSTQGALTQPIGAIHFAGAESSHIWEAHMDGAVRSAERVVAELTHTPLAIRS